jgi:hypothetical protein
MPGTEADANKDKSVNLSTGCLGGEAGGRQQPAHLEGK